MQGPLAHNKLDKFLQMAGSNGGRGPVFLRLGLGRKGRQHLKDPGISLVFLLRNQVSVPWFDCDESLTC
jgi:hypothetical protein